MSDWELIGIGVILTYVLILMGVLIGMMGRELLDEWRTWRWERRERQREEDW